MQFGKLMVLNRTCVNGLIWRKKTPPRTLIGSRDTLDPSFKPKRQTGCQTKKKHTTARGPVSPCLSCCFILNDKLTFCKSVSYDTMFHVQLELLFRLFEAVFAQSSFNPSRLSSVSPPPCVHLQYEWCCLLYLCTNI